MRSTRRSRRSSWRTDRVWGLAPLSATLALGLAFGCVEKESAGGSARADAGADTLDRDGDGFSAADGDCDDNDPTIYPGAREICDDGIDQSCDGRDASCALDDFDEDGYTVANGDCDDYDPTRYPGAREICGDGVDQSCDGADLPCDDADEDRDGFSVNQGDCDDNDSSRYPGAFEICDDGIDQNCDGRDLACDEVDNDGDGYSVADGDCNDENPRIFPGAPEICDNGVDEDCDGEDLPCENLDRDGDGVPDVDDVCPDVPDPFQTDRDGDGVGDVCDNCPTVPNPDQTDSNGNGIGDACDDDTDRDGDGFTTAQGDCDDSDPLVFPGAPERCNGVDDDCNGFVDDACPSDLRTPLVAYAAGPGLLGSQDADPAECARDPRSDENCDEVPQREIRLSAFSVEIHEVTNRQYAACVAAGRCSPPQRPGSGTGVTWFEDPTRAEHPVVWVSQVQAETYCRWALRRLPTEAEWERAARGDAPLAQRRFPWGDSAPTCETANLANCANEPHAARTLEGDRTPTGLYDLAGNVHEMTAGFYYARGYATLPAQDPPPADQPAGMAGAPEQIAVRGGSFRTAAAFSTISYRGFRLLMNHRSGRPEVGFRCVRPD